MMALATHQFKGFCSTLPSLPSSWSRGSKLRHSLPRFDAGQRADTILSWKCKLCSSIGAPLVLGPKSKLSRMSAFKGSCQSDDSGGRANGSKSLRNAVKVSYLQKKNDESSVESSKIQNVVPSPYTAAEETTTSSLAIQNLFKSWLMLLRMRSETQPVDEVLEEPSSSITSEMPNIEQERGDILKAVCCYFLGLDATIKIPLLLLMLEVLGEKYVEILVENLSYCLDCGLPQLLGTPLFLTVDLVYGSKVSKELTPLWILGPLIVALYIKIFRAMCGLYAFSFKQTVQVVKNLPVYYFHGHDYIFHGKLKEAMRTHILEPVADIKNMDYNEVTRRKMKDLQVWLVEIYLDFIESVWPYYCRTMRFLKSVTLV